MDLGVVVLRMVPSDGEQLELVNEEDAKSGVREKVPMA